ncbi:TonB-dependent siderophore receptor [Paenirhodobacter populi]|uniref:TonB-dependent siderophore receptor n=1 Tax=Paenirhodobacter populi TaxID=2306993 RepID=A0A443JAA9_9RHOB|nr:TonB-dependent siderophore receptor [Sinirhodobacter populi]RWR05220.1 TonB-dependent siderophore receptor [Sinirhodobacter populi]RWR17455.1 TonB-dependent siderophore receptor [Sinirhodobacter populi]
MRPTHHLVPQLAILLASTALTVAGTDSLRAETPIELDPLVISATAPADERADGPVKGYVAKQSESAAKIDLPLAKTPASVSVVTADQITDQGARTVADALNYTAGVFGSYRGSSNVAEEIQMRGFGGRTAVAKFIDGMTFGNTNFGQIDPWYFERIEVVKGPSSVAYGQVTPGGVINMVSKRPTEAQDNRVEFSLGNDNFKQVGADLQGDLDGAGALRYRLVALAWDKNLQGDFDQNRVLVAPSLTWTMSDRTEVTVTALYQREPDAGQRGFFPWKGIVTPTADGVLIDPDFISYAPDYDYIDRTTTAVGYDVRHRFGNGWELSHRLRYTDIDMEQSQIGLWSASDDGAGNYSLYRFHDRNSMQQLTADVSLRGEWQSGGLDHKTAVGFDYLHADTGADYVRTGGIFNFSFAQKNYPTLAEIEAAQMDAYTSHTTKKLEQTGIYLQDQMNWGNWGLLVGARYDWAKTKITEDYVSGSRAGSDRATYRDEAATGRAALSYDFGNGLMPYLSYATSFEPVNELDDSGKASFKPEKSRQWELGAKWVSADGDILLTGALFDIQKKNITESVTEEGTTTTRQIGSVRSKGIELEAHAQVSDRVGLVGFYSFTDAYYETGDNTGNQFNAIPMRMAGIWMKYRVAEGVDASLGLRHVGSSWANEANTLKVPGYNLIDAGLSVDLSPLDAGLTGSKLVFTAQNLTDERYASSCVNSYCWLGAGRTISATFTHEW